MSLGVRHLGFRSFEPRLTPGHNLWRNRLKMYNREEGGGGGITSFPWSIALTKYAVDRACHVIWQKDSSRRQGKESESILSLVECTNIVPKLKGRMHFYYQLKGKSV